MKHALLAMILCASGWAQTKTPAATPAPAAAAKTTTPPKAAAPAKAATKAVPKAATKAKATAKATGPTLDLLKPETIRGTPPKLFVVRLETTKGNIDIRVVRDWAPNGVERFYNMVRAGYYNNNYFFRVLDFMAQVGISSNPAVNTVWSDRNIFDDRVVQSNLRGMVTFASTGQPNTRSTQFFINKTDANTYLDGLKFAPFGQVVEGMEIVDQIYKGYGEPPIQTELTRLGEAFINRNYPRMDKIIRATILTVVEP